jgi:hypothetical protein
LQALEHPEEKQESLLSAYHCVEAEAKEEQNLLHQHTSTHFRQLTLPTVPRQEL